jgi:hypothetical protein
VKLCSDRGDSGGKKCGIWPSVHLAGVERFESGCRFGFDAFDRNLASVAVKMFSHLIYFKIDFIYFVLFLRLRG